MRQFGKLFLPLLLCLLLAGCGRREAAPSASEEQPPAETSEPFDPHNLEIVLPEEYLDLLIVTTDLPEVESEGRWFPLLSVSEKASVEAAEADFGSGDGFGFLFGVTALDETAYVQFLQGAEGKVFARDETWYYIETYPTDVQFYRSGGIIDTQTEDWKTWETLNTLGDSVCADMIDRNGLTPYSRGERSN